MELITPLVQAAKCACFECRGITQKGLRPGLLRILARSMNVWSDQMKLRVWGLFLVLLLGGCGLRVVDEGVVYSKLSDSENLFNDGDFESERFSESPGVVMDGWSAYWYPTMDKVTNAHSGKYAMRVRSNSAITTPVDNYDGVKQDFYEPLPQDNYTMSCWLKSAKGSLPMMMGMSDSNFGVASSSKKFTITEGWAQYGYTDFTSPGRTFIILAGTPGTFYIDDCTLWKALAAQNIE